MDQGEGNGRVTTAMGQVYKYGGPGDGGAPHQTPGGPDTYGSKFGFLHGTTTGTHSSGYYQENTVMAVDGRLSGGAGPGRGDSVSL